VRIRTYYQFTGEDSAFTHHLMGDASSDIGEGDTVNAGKLAQFRLERGRDTGIGRRDVIEDDG
jgi:hypothetical protein